MLEFNTLIPSEIFNAIGIIGVIFYMGSYAALQCGFLQGRGYAYLAYNALAASCVLISLIDSFNFSSLLIQVSWIAISAYGIVRLFLLRRHSQYTKEELDLLQYTMPDLPKEFWRRFLNLCEFKEGYAGDVLIRENQPVEHLIYLYQGAAKIKLNENVISTTNRSILFGEIACLDGTPRKRNRGIDRKKQDDDNQCRTA